ncbi:Peroxin-3-domain-containing protein [Sphaerulina musiva SO2202]|uniref:Peroxin-3-domain-containing protein n=1 Tax=Sphaerulina musiva (strain SO2202) TaxID=692275 RepID=N1QF42_SPHMS|nr:Peroxin-3-domain-containing protein [Sphaerulina musiva SO2202]EMF11828.1 Peroxin-3-domain-containing protein [Sphaerulina musiva SO2202]
MIAATRRWFRRNRTNLVVGAGVLGAGYLAGQYVLSKIQEARQRMSEERVAKENLRRRFEQNQEDCTYTVLALLPTLHDDIVGALPVEEITEELQQERRERLQRLGQSEAASSEYPSAPSSAIDDDGKSLASLQSSSYIHASQVTHGTLDVPGGAASSSKPKRSKGQLWQDMKIQSITRALSLLYTMCLLTLLTRIQLNLLGRRTYLSSVVALASPPPATQASTISLENRDDDNYDNVYGNDFETNRKYLTFSWWLLHRGSKQIMGRVMAAVKEVFGPVNIREDVTLERLADLIMQVRRKIEGATEEERRGQKWLEYLLPPQAEEEFVIRQSGSSSDDESPLRRDSDPLMEAGEELITESLRRLLDETSDLIDSPAFSYVLTRLLDASFSHLVDYRIAIEAFRQAPSGREAARIVEVEENKCKLAHVLPIFCKQAHVIGAGSGELETMAGVAAQEPLGNEYLAAVDQVSDLGAFAAVIYSSNFEYEVPQDEDNRTSGRRHGQGVSTGSSSSFSGELGETLRTTAEEMLEESDVFVLNHGQEDDSALAGSAKSDFDAAWKKATSDQGEQSTSDQAEKVASESQEEKEPPSAPTEPPPPEGVIKLN